LILSFFIDENTYICIGAGAAGAVFRDTQLRHVKPVEVVKHRLCILTVHTVIYPVN